MPVAQSLRVSYIELQGTKDVESIELVLPGCRRSIPQQGKNLFREEFPQHLRSLLFFGLSEKKWYSTAIPTAKSVQIYVNDVLSNSSEQKFRIERRGLDITIGLSPNSILVEEMPAQDNSTSPNTGGLCPTIEELFHLCPRFRILVTGQSGTGKSTLINRVFGIEQASAEKIELGKEDIEKEFISPQNDRFVLHVGEGFGPTGGTGCGSVGLFIENTKKRECVKDQLHAVWLCFRVPIVDHGDRLLEKDTETFLREHASVLQNIPTIVVLTKYDQLLAYMAIKKKADPSAAAKEYLQEYCIDPIAKFAGSADLSYVAVSRYCDFWVAAEHTIVSFCCGPNGAESLAKFKDRGINKASPAHLFSYQDLTLFFHSAGKRRYWRAPTDHAALECLAAIHADIVSVWNFNDPSQHLSSDGFREIMTSLVWTIDPSTPAFPTIAMGESRSIALPSATGSARLGPDYGALDVRHKFVTYVIHLVHVLEMLFALTANDNEKKLTRGAISSAFNAYYQSETRRNADIEMKDSKNETLSHDTVLEKMVSLVKMSPMDGTASTRTLESISREDLERCEWHIDIDASEREKCLTSLADQINHLNMQFDGKDNTSILRNIINHQRTILRLTPSWQREHLVCVVNLANSLNERGREEDLEEIINLRRAALQLTPLGHRERVVSLVNLANSLYERYRGDGEGGMEDLTEIITLRHSALQLTPREHQGYTVSLASLADSLHERFRREGGTANFTEIVALRRHILRLTPPEHPNYPEALAKLLDFLDQRFNRERGTEDLDDIISLRRAALQLTPVGHQGRFVSLVNLSNSLHDRFVKGGSLADLDEIITFRRAALECASPSDQCISSLNLANCVREKYQRLGLDVDLTEAIKHARAASIRCLPQHYAYASCIDCVASCIELRAGKRRGPMRTKQEEIIQNITIETIKTLPLRLLDTHTGALCDRDAQISRFEESVQYFELLRSTYDSPECNQSIRGTISKFLGHSVYDLDGGEGCTKLQYFCVLSLRHGYIWAWSDTCCIDKDSSSELQEAIGSMFSWYRNSALTMVHLSDVFGAMSFADSVWFKRGWTLQELLASRRVLFYTQDWSLYMNCTSPDHKTVGTILTELQEVTRIGELQLKNFNPGLDDARSKFQWASTRQTTRAEDVAYSLFGIFQVSLPVMYGETAQNALGRLLGEIFSQSRDILVLDWVGEASSFHSCFPATLLPYRGVPCTQLVPSGPSEHSDADLEQGRELYKALTRLPSPWFFARRLSLPCIVHRVTRVKPLETLSTNSHYDYEFVASGLVPLKLILSCRLQEGSGTDLPYALIRPWNPKLLYPPAHCDVLGNLLEWIGQPFNALLLEALPHNEYRRIASDCLINASVEIPTSVGSSECQTLQIV
ncbi:hypothetical protein EDC04DRAFT_2987623 [Pisolithus marmoratus]|nr:hypothetical protein EDC04DRAFT_2987623 [Pisolithus marmoratus]